MTRRVLCRALWYRTGAYSFVAPISCMVYLVAVLHTHICVAYMSDISFEVL